MATACPAPACVPLAAALEVMTAQGFANSAAFLEACELLCSFHRNLVENPAEPKYQKINSTTHHISSKLLAIAGMDDALGC